MRELILITPSVYEDERGFFLESFQKQRYKKLGIDCEFVQDNHSFSNKSVLRGMHFQKGQAKLVYCPVGQIFDVAVDLRPTSPDFGKWKGVILDEKSHQQFFIPDGFAHGFCVLSEKAHVLYKVSTAYDAKLESGFRFDDKEVGIKWPISDPILSKRDRDSRCLQEVL